ncbi:MAG: PLDc N-terminal domain-containing protein [Pseudomonadota bacterium]
MGLELGLFGIVVLLTTIYALLHVFSSTSTIFAKSLWAVGILVFPIVGFLVWLVVGPRAPRRA